MSEMHETVFIGKSAIQIAAPSPEGEYVTFLNEPFYRIRHFDQMPPFFMSIVSPSDHWMFISSSGGITAGRIDPNSSLFPYPHDTEVTRSTDTTGATALFQVKIKEKILVWEPFSKLLGAFYNLERNLYKNIYGNVLVFEEINHDLGLAYRYAWRMSEKFGFVMSAWLQNRDSKPVSLTVLSGLRNILPYAAGKGVASPVTDSYKYCELEPATGLGVFSLTASPTNQTDPREALKATLVWQTGLSKPGHLLSSRQLDAFRTGKPVSEEPLIRGFAGAYLLFLPLTLSAGQEHSWHIAADVNQDHSNLASRIRFLSGDTKALISELETDLAKSTQDLKSMMAQADGLQLTGDTLGSAHHFSNVLFNVMRGGLYADGYWIDKTDLMDYVQVRNHQVFKESTGFFKALPDRLNVEMLRQKIDDDTPPALERLCREYLPLFFSRRHGDPSRPWNDFSIRLKKDDGSPRLYFEGNWRDLFQNWEALSWSFPCFLEAVTLRFLNGTTADGYNPLKIGRDGVRWEKDLPWETHEKFGYWSDHQIVYLERFLDMADRINPGELKTLLGRPIFGHVEVPYRIRSFDAMVQNQYKTVDFDPILDKKIDERMEALGKDGMMVLTADQKVLQVNLVEKLLVLLLAKFANWVPDGGIWMNTQKPEWNDANNALVGKGVSVVTLCQVRKFIAVVKRLLTQASGTSYTLTEELSQWFESTAMILSGIKLETATRMDDSVRFQTMAALGRAGTNYREKIYKHGFTGAVRQIDKQKILNLLDTALLCCEHSIQANRRQDALYHSYNVILFRDGKAILEYLDEMLEGQVAVLASGVLDGKASLALLTSLRKSRLFRADQYSYILYPDRKLTGFLKLNTFQPSQVEGVRLVAELIKNDDKSLIVKDVAGALHFNGEIKNALDIKRILNHLKSNSVYKDLVDRDSERILDLFESLFSHSKYLGRSTIMFGYEGLGCIYWHMVSKLLLASQEAFFEACEAKDSEAVINGLADAYYDIRKGIGFNKSPVVYGAFPTDPYSHTPGEEGAKQPGMTGQVKEEILTRPKEFGLFVEKGCLVLKPWLLRGVEFLSKPAVFEFFNTDSKPEKLELESGSFAFTCCQVPVVFRKGGDNKIEIDFSDGTKKVFTSLCLDASISQSLFRREGRIRRILVDAQACR